MNTCAYIKQNFLYPLNPNFFFRWILSNEVNKEAPFKNWQNGEPNNVNNEDCAIIVTGHDYRWNDVPCHNKYQSVCEIKVNMYCPKGWASYGDACYRHTDKKMTFDDQQIYCHLLGGYLAAPQSKDQNDKLLVFMKRKRLSYAWLGIDDRQKEDRYLCSINMNACFYLWRRVP